MRPKKKGGFTPPARPAKPAVAVFNGPPEPDHDWLLLLSLAVLALWLFMNGCSGAQLREADTVYTDLHLMRISVEAIPGVVPLVNAWAPWAPEVRLGLDVAYVARIGLLPKNYITAPTTTTEETR